ncbi:MAG: ATP-binding cassette domain-containing protein, partial [Alphaproteobacteria bacterium]|nr:ATP-binding cassette domain-containing protein [Alphaproteobacteria bacterium]
TKILGETCLPMMNLVIIMQGVFPRMWVVNGRILFLNLTMILDGLPWKLLFTYLKRKSWSIPFSPLTALTIIDSDPEMTAEENILVPVWSTNIQGYEGRLSWIYEIIPECKGFREMAATSLSGGQQKLVALARALMVGQKLLLLDEPTEGIAPVLALRMGEILASLKREGVSIIIAESNDAHVSDVIDRTYTIERGSIVTA